MGKLKYNEFRSKYAEKGFDAKNVAQDWAKYKDGKFKFTVKKAPLPAEIKAFNARLTEKLNYLFELRKQKKAGKDVKEEIKKTLKYLKDNREKKKEKLKELGLL